MSGLELAPGKAWRALPRKGAGAVWMKEFLVGSQELES